MSSNNLERKLKDCVKKSANLNTLSECERITYSINELNYKIKNSVKNKKYN